MLKKITLWVLIAAMLLTSPITTLADELHNWQELKGNTDVLKTTDEAEVERIKSEIKSLVGKRSVGFYYEALESGESYSIGETRRITSASITKLS